MKTKGERLHGIVFEHVALPAKLLDYFLRSNKSNINPSPMVIHNMQKNWMICKEVTRHDNADAAGNRSHDGQSRDDRRIKLDLANVGADGVSVAVRICE